MILDATVLLNMALAALAQHLTISFFAGSKIHRWFLPNALPSVLCDDVDPAHYILYLGANRP